MRKYHKRLTIDDQIFEEGKKLPFLNQSQFSAKLNDLLDKVSIQNRYASRISHCNMKNLQELEQAKEELKKIAEEKKMEQLKANDTKDLIQQMTLRVKDSESELQKLFKEIIAAKKQIKHLKAMIADLQNENLLLEKQVLQAKRQKFEQVCTAREELDVDLLSTNIGNFLLTSMNINSFLYNFCLNAHRTNSFANFFEELDMKIEKQLKNKNKYSSVPMLDNRLGSNLKFKISKNYSIDEKDRRIAIKRYQTQHHQVRQRRKIANLNDSLQ